MKKVMVFALGLLVVDRLAKAIAYYGLDIFDGFILLRPIPFGFCNAPNPGYFHIVRYPALSWILPMLWPCCAIAIFIAILAGDYPDSAKTAIIVGLIAVISQFGDMIMYHAVIDYFLIGFVVLNIADVMLWSAGGAFVLILARHPQSSGARVHRPAPVLHPGPYSPQ